MVKDSTRRTPGWSVLVEAEAPAGTERLPKGDKRPDAFADILTTQHAGVVSSSLDGWSARISVDAIDPVHDDQQAAEAGRRLVLGAAAMVGLPQWPVVRLEAVREDVLDAELRRSPFPDVVGAREVTEMLGISRQRLHELRRDGRFPEPMVELAAGPIWLRAAIETFLRTWDRRPGRPAAPEKLEAVGKARINAKPKRLG